MMKKLIEVKNLRTSFFSLGGEVKAVNDVSFYVQEGEIVAIVGESGCGKSVTQMSIMRLIQTPPGKILGGEVFFEGKDLLKLPLKEMRSIRGSKIAMIFQEPMTSLNPVYTIGNQVSEVIRTHLKCSKKEAWNIGIKALKAVDIPEPEMRMKNYPFELSGGMRQRVLIAIAVACNSRLIIADEPTTALDVTTQAQVMDLLLDIVKTNKKSMIVVTHNLGLVTRYAERIYVMYAGRIVESGYTRDILMDAKHPYTNGLLKSVPDLYSSKDVELVPIDGAPPSLAHLPKGCPFAPRCSRKNEKCCQEELPVLERVGDREHYSACFLNEEIRYDKQEDVGSC